MTVTMASTDFFGVHSLSPSERADAGLDLGGPASLGSGPPTLGPVTLDPAERLRRVRSLLESHAHLIASDEGRESFLDFLAYVDTPEDALQAIDLLEDQLEDDYLGRLKALRAHVTAYAR